MDPTIVTTILTMMAGAIAAEFAFIIYLYRWSINRADERIKCLEQREESTLQVVVDLVRPLPGLINSMIGEMRELRSMTMQHRQ